MESLPEAYMNESFQVLINYHDMDKNYAHQITQYLTEKGIRVWFDVEQLIPGRPKQESLESCLLYTSDAADE